MLLKAYSAGRYATAHPSAARHQHRFGPDLQMAIPALQRSGVIAKRCLHRPVRYLKNIIEQDHRAIKKRVNAKQGFRAFGAARRTIAGYEAIHMMREGQVRWLPAHDVKRQIQFVDRLFGLST